MWRRLRITTAAISPHKRRPRPNYNTTPPIRTTSIATTTVGRASAGCATNNYEDGSDRATTTPTNGVETGAGGTADLVAAAEDTADDTSGPLLPLGIVGGAVLAAGGLVLVRRRSVRRD